MCGIAGCWHLDNTTLDARRFSIMTNVLRHRGPDDEGYTLFKTHDKSFVQYLGDDSQLAACGQTPHIQTAQDACLGFGFRRLSIVDLSELGHQPMSDETGRYHIIFNGEIYNFRELREELKAAGYSFRSKTDTEVILYAYRHWGEECLHRFNGMWAFAIYDVEERRLFLSRDRYGVKPLYYTYNAGKSFSFASEIKSLLAYGHPFRLNHDAVFDYFFRDLTCHNPFTFFEGVFLLEPGMKMTVSEKGFSKNRWYHLPKINADVSFSDSCLQFRALLEDSINLRQKCDVPFGYTLSGGVDSSSIVCTAANLRDISSDSTFSLVFPGRNEDESRYVEEVIRKTGFNCETITATPEDLSRDLSDFIKCQEEPFGSISYYGEYRLRNLIKNRNIVVTLEGQGADEIISGYRSLLPSYFESLICDGKWLQLKKEMKLFSGMVPNSKEQIAINLMKKVLGIKDRAEYNKYSMINPEKLSLNTAKTSWSNRLGIENHMLDMLTTSSIPEQLIRADKSSMAFSTESRFPFLDYRLVELAVSLPYSYKIHNGVTKRILRESLKDILPQKIYQRRDKLGFVVPVLGWIDESMRKNILEQSMDCNVPFIDKNGFRDAYQTKESIDWVFWKVASFTLWMNTYSDYAGNLSR